MPANKSSCFLLNQGPYQNVSLALATLVAAVVIVACRVFTRLLEFDHAELDGIVFMAGIYWILSVIGYFVSRAKTPLRSRTESPRYAHSFGSRGADRNVAAY